MDATLVFFLLLAGYLLLKAVDRQKAWMVVVSFGLIGVAFNIKMLQAFMILPAMFFFYWIASRQNWKKNPDAGYGLGGFSRPHVGLASSRGFNGCQ